MPSDSRPWACRPSPHYSAIRDGNRAAIPEDYLPKDYEVPAIRIHPFERLLPLKRPPRDD